MDDDHKAVYEALHQAQTASQAVALATVVSTQGSMPRHAGSKLLAYADGSTVGTIGGGSMESLVIKAALDALETGEPRLETYTLNNLEDGDPGICGGAAQIFIEPILPAPQLLVIGGGHCGVELAKLGKWLGYRVILSDDRPEYCNPTYISGLDEYVVCKPESIPDHVKIGKDTYTAAVTRGLPVDIQLIPTLLKTQATYIGLIGSKRRWALTVQALRETYNITDADLDRIHSPIGLELQAETPKEIALSIMAEITMLRRGGTDDMMKRTAEQSVEQYT